MLQVPDHIADGMASIFIFWTIFGPIALTRLPENKRAGSLANIVGGPGVWSILQAAALDERLTNRRLRKANAAEGK